MIASELNYFSALSEWNLTSETANITKVSSLGAASIYIGFSHRYFGEKRAKKLAKDFDLEINKLINSKQPPCS